MNETPWDVVVVGSGPAGAASAAFLAAQDFRVLVLERESFPRFHIGESLLPACLPVLDRLGVEATAASFTFKAGAEFVCERSGRSRTFDFARALPGPPRHAWQVERAGFDAALQQSARRFGATIECAKVIDVDVGPDAVAVHTREGVHRARYLIDASGQNRLLARKHGAAEPIDLFGRTAAFVHFDGIGDDALEEIGPGHDIRIMMVEAGWGWIIPLPGRRLSVGLVSRLDAPAAKLIEDYLEGSDIIRRWSRGATKSEPRLERNYSFRNLRPAGARFACIGDAACFLDPVFSSGVSLALVGAASLAKHLAPALHERSEAAPDLLDTHLEHMNLGYRTFGSMIDRFYNTKFVDHFIFGDSPDARRYQEIVSVLAGDVWNPENGFAAMLARSRRGPRAAAPPARDTLQVADS